jgi:hypothetical protein
MRSRRAGYTRRMREHTGTAIAVAAVLTTVLAMFAWVLVVVTWTALTIYALVKWIGSAPDSASATTVLLIIVGIVTGLALVLTVPIALVGRSMTPRRRKKNADADALPVPADTLPPP